MLKNLIKFEKGHEIVHFLKKFNIKIYDAGSDIEKDWYLWWSFRNPITGKMTRQVNIKIGCNRIKNKAERYAFLKKIEKYLIYEIKNGYSPYEKEEKDILEKFEYNKKYTLKEKTNASYKMQENKLYWQVDENTRTRQILDLLPERYHSKDQSMYGEFCYRKKTRKC